MKATELIAKIEAYAPRDLAWECDPIGLQLGDPNQEIHTVMTALDVRRPLRGRNGKRSKVS